MALIKAVRSQYEVKVRKQYRYSETRLFTDFKDRRARVWDNRGGLACSSIFEKAQAEASYKPVYLPTYMYIKHVTSLPI